MGTVSGPAGCFSKYMIVPLHPCTSACKSLYLMWEHPFGKSLSTLPPFLCGTQHLKKTVEAMGYGKGVNTEPILFNPFQVSNHIKLSHFWVWFWASRISIGLRGFESPDVRQWIESMDFRIVEAFETCWNKWCSGMYEWFNETPMYHYVSVYI